MSKDNFTLEQKTELKKCFKACETLFLSKCYADIPTDENGEYMENTSSANLCHRAICMIYIKARDMKLIPWFEVAHDDCIGFKNTNKYDFTVYNEVLNNAIETALSYYNWSFPAQFNCSEPSQYSTELNDTVADLLIDTLSDYIGELYSEEMDDNLLDSLQYFSPICLFHPKLSAIEMQKISHPEFQNDEAFMKMYHEMRTYFTKFSTIYGEIEGSTTIVDNQYYNYSIYEHDTLYDLSYIKDPLLHLHPGCIFLLHDLEETMDNILNYISRAVVPSL